MNYGAMPPPQSQIHFRQQAIDGRSDAIVMLHQTASLGNVGESHHHIDGAVPTIAFDTPGFGNGFDPRVT